MTTGSLLLLSSLFLSMGIFEYDGLYSIFALTWLMLGFTSLLVAALGYLKKLTIPVATPTDGQLICALLLFLYMSNFKMPGDFVEATGEYARWFFRLQASLIVLFCTAFFFVPRPTPVLKHRALILGLAVAVLLRIGMLSASHSPSIDVFSAAQHAMEAFLNGEKSPYTTDMSGIAAFYYPPLNFYLQMISYAPIGDVRGIYIVSEIAFAGLLFWMARRSMGMTSALLTASLFLFQPRGLYILEMAWTEPPILAFFGLSLFLFLRGNRNASAVAYGCAVSLKQYLVFFLLHWFLLERTWWKFVLMIAAAVATVVPFLIWDPANTIAHGFLETLSGGIRKDSLTMVTFLQQTIGITLPRMTSFIVGLAVSLGTFFAFRHSPKVPAFLFSSAITTFALFLFGSQAFANYYYVVSGLVLMVMVLHADTKSA